MNKVLFAGKTKNNNIKIFLKAKYADGRFSISGVEGPYRNGNCAGGCGQIIDSLREALPEGDLSKEQIDKVVEYWDRWHLNDLNAGSPAQEKFLRDNPLGNVADHFYSAQTVLMNNGLEPDYNFMGKDGKPYHYGTAWNTEEVPAHVIEFFESLPDSSITPSWV
jgi:hypothetical protein